MPRDCLREYANYYEEIEVDLRAKCSLLRALKKRIRLQRDKIYFQEIRKALPGYLGWGRFVETWKPCGVFLSSRQKLLFERYEEYFPETSVLLLYRPKTLRGSTLWSPSLGPC